MNRIIASVIASLVVACGAPAEDVDGTYEGIGQLEQPVYMPAGFGIEGVNNWQGHPDFGMQCAGTLPSEVADNYCSVPDSKTIKIKWYPSTCNDEWDTAMYNATVRFTNEMTLIGWSVVEGTEPDSLKCGSISGSTVLGKFSPGPDWDEIGASYGTLGQFKNGKIVMDSADSDAFCNGFITLPANRLICKENLIYHELQHKAGLGHTNHGSGSNLMSEAPNGTWATQKNRTAAQITMQQCYNPANGGLFDDC